MTAPAMTESYDWSLTDPNIFARWGSMCATDHYDYHRQHQRHEWPTPEHRLLAAMLEDAVICYSGVIGGSPHRRRQIAGDAELWFESSEDIPFAFVWLMGVLLPDVDVARFRRLILARPRPGLAADYAGYKGGHRIAKKVQARTRSGAAP